MNLNDTVTVLAAGTSTDRYGQEALDWSAATSVTTPAWVGGQNTTEVTTAGDRILTRLACIVPADVTVTAQSRIVWRANTYDIDGEPLPMSRRGALHHYEMTLTRVEG